MQKKKISLEFVAEPMYIAAKSEEAPLAEVGDLSDTSLYVIYFCIFGAIRWCAYLSFVKFCKEQQYVEKLLRRCNLRNIARYGGRKKNDTTLFLSEKQSDREAVLAA